NSAVITGSHGPRSCTDVACRGVPQVPRLNRAVGLSALRCRGEIAGVDKSSCTERAAALDRFPRRTIEQRYFAIRRASRPHDIACTGTILALGRDKIPHSLPIGPYARLRGRSRCVGGCADIGRSAPLDGIELVINNRCYPFALPSVPSRSSVALISLIAL